MLAQRSKGNLQPTNCSIIIQILFLWSTYEKFGRKPAWFGLMRGSTWSENLQFLHRVGSPFLESLIIIHSVQFIGIRLDSHAELNMGNSIYVATRECAFITFVGMLSSPGALLSLSILMAAVILDRLFNNAWLWVGCYKWHKII